MSEPATGNLLPIFQRTSSPQRTHELDRLHGKDIALAWKLFRLNWLLIAIVLAVFDLCLLLTDFRVQPLGYLAVLIVAALYGVSGYRNALSPRRSKPWVFSLLTAIAQTILVVSILTSLTYIATAANLPLQDLRLLAIDRALGFDFRNFLSFVDSHPWAAAILALGYNSIGWQIFLIVFGLPLTGHHRRAAEYVCALLLALSATTCITMAVPAIGVYHATGLNLADLPNIVPGGYLETLHEMPLVRSGALRALDIGHLGGVVTFPSFHAATAALYIWGLWPFRWLRLFNLTINGAMLVATPIGGGHFLIDVLAGIAVALTSIGIAQLAGRFLARSEQSPQGGQRRDCAVPTTDLERAARRWARFRRRPSGCGGQVALPLTD
jgi:PAP2 superfamily